MPELRLLAPHPHAPLKRSEAQLAADAARKARTAKKYRGWARSGWWMKAKGYDMKTIARYLGVTPRIAKKAMEMFRP